MPKRTDIQKVMIIGSGPIVIGQACEFDYSGTQACKALRSLGYEIVLVNSNPATIMTDPGTADHTYIEPLNAERMEQIIRDTVKRLSASIPGISYFLYNYNFNDIKGRPMASNGGTSHCCLWVPEFVRFEREGCTGLQFVKNVIEGKTTQIGRDLLK